MLLSMLNEYPALLIILYVYSETKILFLGTHLDYNPGTVISKIQRTSIENTNKSITSINLNVPNP